MGDWLARAWLQGAGDGNPEEEDRTARQQYVISVHDSWPRGRPALNSLMITVLDEVCDMVDHETGYGTFTVERIVERVSVGGPLTADQVRLALQHLMRTGVSSATATISTRCRQRPIGPRSGSAAGPER